MQPLIWDRRPDGLRAPALVCAFQGWNDAGDAASGAVSFLASSLRASRFARVEPEEFFDFQSTRPRIRFSEHDAREITWPGVEVFEGRAPKAPRDTSSCRASSRRCDGARSARRWSTSPRRSACSWW
jgi:hypothetical protein